MPPINRNLPMRRMELPQFEALQRAAVAQAVASGVNQPMLINGTQVPPNVMALQVGFRDAVMAGKFGPANFDLHPALPPDLRQIQAAFLRNYFTNGRR